MTKKHLLAALAALVMVTATIVIWWNRARSQNTDYQMAMLSSGGLAQKEEAMEVLAKKRFLPLFR